MLFSSVASAETVGWGEGVATLPPSLSLPPVCEREKEGQSRQEDREWEAQRAGEKRRYKDRRRAAMDGKRERERDERESES